MPAGHLNLLLDQVKIIQQPFGGGSNEPCLVYRQSRAVKTSQDLLVFVQSSQQAVGTAPWHELVPRGQDQRMAAQLFHIEQLRPQRRLARARSRPLLPG